MTPFRLGSSQDITASTSITIPSGIRGIRICGQVDARVAMSPNAAASGAYVPAGVPEYFLCHAGDVVNIAPDSATGTINVAYLTR